MPRDRGHGHQVTSERGTRLCQGEADASDGRPRRDTRRFLGGRPKRVKRFLGILRSRLLLPPKMSGCARFQLGDDGILWQWRRCGILSLLSLFCDPFLPRVRLRRRARHGSDASSTLHSDHDVPGLTTDFSFSNLSGRRRLRFLLTLRPLVHWTKHRTAVAFGTSQTVVVPRQLMSTLTARVRAGLQQPLTSQTTICDLELSQYRRIKKATIKKANRALDAGLERANVPLRVRSLQGVQALVLCHGHRLSHTRAAA